MPHDYTRLRLTLPVEPRPGETSAYAEMMAYKRAWLQSVELWLATCPLHADAAAEVSTTHAQLRDLMRRV